ncbi:Cfap44 [Symbiodinium sp. CCMP2456]|nr:Cfap44 [Symbiodinium sp. CCMP2456]
MVHRPSLVCLSFLADVVVLVCPRFGLSSQRRQASKEIIEGIRRKRSTSIQSSTHDDDAQDKIDAEEARWRIPASFFYDPSSPELNPPLEDRELPRQGTRAARFMGFDFSRINNAVWTSNEEFAYITGHVVCFMNIRNAAACQTCDLHVCKKRGASVRRHGADSGSGGSPVPVRSPSCLAMDGENDTLGNETFLDVQEEIEEEIVSEGCSQNVFLDLCSALGIYAVHRCSAPRAGRTCAKAYLPPSAGQTRCRWNDRCMRCLPPPLYLNDTGCNVDGVFFRADGSCPYPVQGEVCNVCEEIYLQEVCLGLCSDLCIWTNLSRFRGVFCTLRDPPPPPDQTMLLRILMIGGGVIGFFVLVYACRVLCRGVLAAREKAKQQRLKELQSRAKKGKLGAAKSMTTTRRVATRSETALDMQAAEGAASATGRTSMSLHSAGSMASLESRQDEAGDAQRGKRASVASAASVARCGRSQKLIEEGGHIRAGVGTRPDMKRGNNRDTGRRRCYSYVARLRVKTRESKLRLTCSAAAAVSQGGSIERTHALKLRMLKAPTKLTHWTTAEGKIEVAVPHFAKGHNAGLRLSGVLPSQQGCAPDYLLSVWDWRNERLLLKCKAYGQDVFSIRWGQFPGMLTSVGVGHIRFWKMATTFTGLKLQGALGKFGASELSDISGFVELPDGKVVSGTEYGKLLVWEGVFVKVELMCAKEGTSAQEAATNLAGSPHAGAIDVILSDKENGLVISGGDDGFLRWWPIDEIDSAEADYDNGILEYGIRMRKEVRIPPSSEQHIYPAHIQHVAVCPDGETWLVQDSRNGMVWLYDIASTNCQMVFSCHSKQVTGTVVSSSYSGLMMSCGMDGTVRAFNVSQAWDNELLPPKSFEMLGPWPTRESVPPAPWLMGGFTGCVWGLVGICVYTRVVAVDEQIIT